MTKNNGAEERAGSPLRDHASDSVDVNPYQPPTFDPDDQGPELIADEGKGRMFAIASAVLIVFTVLATVVTAGLASPLLFAAVLGTMRASALWALHKQSRRRSSPTLLLLTSTVLTLLMMFSCVIAFATICMAGALTTMPEVSVMLWVGLCTLAAMVAFIFLFIRSLKWSV